jgi:hypothetical protein
VCAAIFANEMIDPVTIDPVPIDPVTIDPVPWPGFANVLGIEHSTVVLRDPQGKARSPPRHADGA